MFHNSLAPAIPISGEFRTVGPVERKETPEARFAAALDRLEPLIQNAHTEGHAWIKYGITKDQVINKNRPSLVGGSEELWIYAEKLIAESANKGYFP
ncbi:MAG: phosphohydrolase [Acidobacteria bacterium]|nr:phosphohydrolase [Acidobacteriota bacterium]